jgi:hypothetical protein
MTTALFTAPTPALTATGYGLLSVATVTDSTDRHAQGGSQWQTTGCGVATPFAIDCAPSESLPSLTGTGGLPWVTGYPFGVVAGVSCKPVGMDVADLADEARTILRLSEQHAIERAFWKGGVWPAGVASPHLASPAAQVLTTGPVSPKAALGMLEQAIGDMTGGIGVIHAPRLAVGQLGGDMGLRQQGGRLLTLLDTPVAMGIGYDGTGPDGTRTAGQAWVYATGPVQVVRGQAFDLPADPRYAVNRETNETTVQAARIVSVAHACGIVAAQVNLA